MFEPVYTLGARPLSLGRSTALARMRARQAFAWAGALVAAGVDEAIARESSAALFLAAAPAGQLDAIAEAAGVGWFTDRRRPPVPRMNGASREP